MKMTNKIIKNNSKGYGYNYASLSDIVEQGYDLPKMITGTDPQTNAEYIYYQDGEVWLRGAKVVVPESKGMNAAQLYGSALTYARRYTVLMALGLSCDDDKVVEDISADGSKKSANTSQKQDKIKELESLFTKEEIDQILVRYSVENLSKIEDSIIDKYINFRKYGKHNTKQ